MKEPPPGTAGDGWTGRTHREFRVRRTEGRERGALPIPRMGGDRQGAVPGSAHADGEAWHRAAFVEEGRATDVLGGERRLLNVVADSVRTDGR